uniref:Uncharacterized protein n=1 Tax=Cucumis melo TaxID=3656 RepID=A0A9I9DA18_CUCME
MKMGVTYDGMWLKQRGNKLSGAHSLRLKLIARPTNKKRLTRLERAIIG